MFFVPTIVFATIGLEEPDNAVFEILKSQRSPIHDVEFHYEVETSRIENGQIVGQPSRKSGFVKMHKEGVYFQSESLMEEGGRRVHEVSTRLGGNLKWKSVSPNPRDPPLQRLDSHMPALPYKNLCSPMTGWPTLHFSLTTEQMLGPLVRTGTEQINSVVCEIVERRRVGGLTKYWFDLARQGSLMQSEDYDASGRLANRVYDFHHAKVKGNDGVDIWFPQRFMIDAFIRADEIVKKEFLSRCTVDIVPTSVKANTGRSANETEVQFAAGVPVRDATKTSSLERPMTKVSPTRIPDAELKEAVKNKLALADVPRGQPTSNHWWWLIVVFLAGVGATLLIVKRREGA